MRADEKEGAVLLAVKVVPNSSRTMVAGWLGEALKVKVAQPAEGGKANKAVVELLADVLGVVESRVQIVGRQTQAWKRVRVAGMSGEAVLAKLGV